ncbi:MAG: UvrD-helicase domain-containing protein [Xylanivirga thermophila]|jgi:hypothetical protein|uniref:UvrD-helicase domain-containing protein n=1 Tax=Xylanivirga thermophila TaxID=2496273 RepID=UPI0039F4B09D
MLLDKKQQEILNLPINSKVIIKGCVGSGKTTVLKERYLKLIRDGLDSSRILVMVLNRGQSLIWQEEVDDMVPGEVMRTSYFGFVQREVRTYWPVVLNVCSKIRRHDIEPNYLSFEAAQHLMNQTIDRYRERGFLPDISAPSHDIGMQLMNALTSASLANIPYNQIGTRLYGGRYDANLMDMALYDQMDTIIEDYINKCLECGCLDYAMSAYIYNDILLGDDVYQASLKDRFDALLVDNCEEMTPAAANLIDFLLSNVKNAFFSFGYDGGYSRFYGAHPEYVLKVIEPQCASFSLDKSYTCTQSMCRFAREFGDGIKTGLIPFVLVNTVDIEWAIDTDLRSEMLDRVGCTVQKLVDEGYAPNDIAVISPFVDPVLEGVLHNFLNDKGIEVVNSTRRRRAKDNSFINAMVTFASIAHPEYEILPDRKDIGDAVGLILGIDPIRADLLAQAIVREKPYMLPAVEDIAWRGRIGIENSKKYAYVREWLLDYIKGPFIPIDGFFKRMFMDILVPLPQSRQNINYCKQLIDTASAFLDSLSAIEDEKKAGREFILTILKGAKGAETILDMQEVMEREGVLLTTPINYLSTSRHKKVQIWCDIRSNIWLPRDIKELFNPYVLSVDWDMDGRLTPDKEEYFAFEKLSVIVKSLLCRCGERVILSSSRYNGQGYEEEGLLAMFWDKALKGRDS